MYTLLTVKEFWKSVGVCGSYDHKSSVLFFETQCNYATKPLSY